MAGLGWDSAARHCRVPAKDPAEAADMYERGEKFYEYESVRVFTKFGASGGEPDPYGRLSTKLKKKLKQTKTTAEHFGKIVFVEVPFGSSDRRFGKAPKGCSRCRTEFADSALNCVGPPGAKSADSSQLFAIVHVQPHGGGDEARGG